MKWDNHSRDGELGKERKGQRDINRGKVTELMIRERERQTDRERDRERERETDRQTDRQTDRETERDVKCKSRKLWYKVRLQ